MASLHPSTLSLPPHIKFRMRQLDWTNCLLQLSYFLGFFGEEYAHTMHPILHQQRREEVIAHVLSKAPADHMAELGLDAAKLTNWADLAYSLQSSAIDYEPTGSVQSMDIFCATPLAAVARDMEDRMTNQLSKWRDFCRSPPRFHCVDGAHYTMISPAHVCSFQKIFEGGLARPWGLNQESRR
jgi:thioesterase domain-containing protein